mmetsp:Transcript_16088/g.23695  ORF Transcript_16088/g.23695 Transcript_16088/m.23695 type:complete len:131 (-) Transcript_16088:47-439(-)|eukprot:CAMPEP_0116009002 /NCGR_PEP_ID=MMETSP0321-20121206/3186_1 /TAXON_ID=163516 /ORGANISM="Leptocylindrus danicus var. danicus, Strain B650" /LENGTH=130 /DNA_ID=CAMNT_0003477907 /DNA_START=336 /DNA_END=728 /DNA_ORIENTATION=-
MIIQDTAAKIMEKIKHRDGQVRQCLRIPSTMPTRAVIYPQNPTNEKTRKRNHESTVPDDVAAMPPPPSINIPVPKTSAKNRRPPEPPTICPASESTDIIEYMFLTRTNSSKLDALHPLPVSIVLIDNDKP